LDGKDYKDGDMDPKKFFDLERNGHVPRTSQLTPAEAIDVFEGFLSQGRDILYIAFSSGLSGSCGTINLVATDMRKKYPEREIYVVDSLCASLGLGLLVDYAVKMRDEGKSISETYKWLEVNKLNLNHWFTVDSLDHLRRGGRLSGGAAFVGNLLQIKPVLNVDHEGHLIPREKVKGRKKALRLLVEKMEELVINPDGQQIFISHGDDLEAAEKVAEMIKEIYPGVGGFMMNMIGSVIGAHAGPGTIALFFMGKSR
jgi:DegV family protein with EDD domain